MKGKASKDRDNKAIYFKEPTLRDNNQKAALAILH
ncbi:Uncharacterised protein [Candidatus Bartonella washoeensis]|uniref:Uncharacterized protein n=2 Tax=Candidatus Bartonella washoeensis TaxID=186739 RepID=J0QT70_9HYPH|nr:hypothetical protein MCQ_01048 [Bartonella washoeensis Sb944nv]EJF86304.1 hypothetical protein MCW_00200 [Bartonella washoeensis 085-0475]SPU27195.1 Uncharacterised protein [Bartonella washoeensis]